MTPFGKALRELRKRKGVRQADMAAAIGVSAAYLSALEHGHRGKPSFDFLQRVVGYFNIIWDEAEELFILAEESDPRVVLDTSDMPFEYTAFANRLAKEIRSLSPDVLERMTKVLESGGSSG